MRTRSLGGSAVACGSMVMNSRSIGGAVSLGAGAPSDRAAASDGQRNARSSRSCAPGRRCIGTRIAPGGTLNSTPPTVIGSAGASGATARRASAATAPARRRPPRRTIRTTSAAKREQQARRTAPRCFRVVFGVMSRRQSVIESSRAANQPRVCHAPRLKAGAITRRRRLPFLKDALARARARSGRVGRSVRCCVMSPEVVSVAHRAADRLRRRGIARERLSARHRAAVELPPAQWRRAARDLPRDSGAHLRGAVRHHAQRRSAAAASSAAASSSSCWRRCSPASGA